MKRTAALVVLIALIAFSMVAFGVAEIDSSAVYDCVTSAAGVTASSVVELENTSHYAQFYLYSEGIIAGYGGESPEGGVFLRPDSEAWSFPELWGIYGNIISYVHDHKLEIISDGLISVDYDPSKAVTISIVVCDDACIYAGIYDLETDEIRMKIVNNPEHS